MLDCASGMGACYIRTCQFPSYPSQPSSSWYLRLGIPLIGALLLPTDIVHYMIFHDVPRPFINNEQPGYAHMSMFTNNALLGGGIKGWGLD